MAQETEMMAPALTEDQIRHEATNEKLKDNQFELGGRTFTVVSLRYKQYLRFVGSLKPVLELLTSKAREGIMEAVGSRTKINVQGIAFNALGSVDPDYLMKFAEYDLPNMVEMVCNMASIIEDKAEDMVSVDWIMEMAESPFQLFEIVLMQVIKNKMIAQFADFFAQALPLILGQTSQAR